MALKLRSAKPLDGARWMMSGVRLLLRYPLSHLAIISLMSLALGLTMSLPYVGATLALVLLPGLSAGWVLCSAQGLAGTAPSPLRLWTPWRSTRRGVLLRLGLMHAACAWLMLWLADAIDPSFRDQWATVMMGASTETPPAAGLVEAVQAGALLRGAMLVPVALLFWHAPVIALRGQDSGGAAKALFASVLATGRNLTAFGVYGLCWLLADMAFSSLLVALLGALDLAGAALAIMMPMTMLFASAFYASLHASVSGCIDLSDDKPVAPVDSPVDEPPAATGS